MRQNSQPCMQQTAGGVQRSGSSGGHEISWAGGDTYGVAEQPLVGVVGAVDACSAI